MSATWIPLAEAARRLEVNPHTVRRMADLGVFTERRLPFCQPRVLSSEVAELAKKCTRRPTEPAVA